MKWFLKRCLLILLLVFSIAFPARADISLEDEEKAGKSSDKLVKEHFGVYEDEKLQEYIERIGQKLLESIEDPMFKFHFTVVDDPMLNAFALPGGYIYITRGMLAYLDSEAALAGVLGHEIGHVIGHHAFKAMKKSLKDMLVVLAGVGAGIASGQSASDVAAWVTAGVQVSQMASAGYGREMEMQSDEFGLIYAYDAGYDPGEHAKFFRMLQFKRRMSGSEYHGFMASHPETIERIIRAREKADVLKNRGGKVEIKRDEYLTMIEGLTYGKGNKRAKLPPPYVIALYTSSKGDDFRKIARDVAGDEAMAFEIAVMNAMREKDEIPPGYLLKIPVKRKLQPENAPQ